jgi:hypothetical protein
MMATVAMIAAAVAAAVSAMRFVFIAGGFWVFGRMESAGMDGTFWKKAHAREREPKRKKYE